MTVDTFWNWIKVAIITIMFLSIVILVAIWHPTPQKPINYEQKYDSLKQQLQLERANRITYTHTIDSLTLVTDSLTKIKEQIQVEIRYIPGRYNQYNSEELQQKIIEAYDARQVN